LAAPTDLDPQQFVAQFDSRPRVARPFVWVGGPYRGSEIARDFYPAQTPSCKIAHRLMHWKLET
jgi:hypothetical protein